MDDAVARLVRVSDDGALVWTSDLNTTDDTTSNYFEHLVREGALPWATALVD